MATTEILRAEKFHCGTESQRFYRPELDVLRFFAFLAVYVCHSIPNYVVPAAAQMNAAFGLRVLAAIKDAGNFGVCLFFLLSAFLITELLQREEERFGCIHVGAFYLRRILRIWPLYFGVTAVYAVAGYHFPAMRMEVGRVAAYFLLAGNWYIALHPWIQTPLRSLWSISVEEQFYLLWPVLARLGGVRSLALASVTILPLSLLTISVVSSERVYTYNTVWLNSFTQFQFFAGGALLACVLSGGTLKLSRFWRIAMGLAGLALWFISAYATHIKRPGALASPLQVCFGYLLVAGGCILLLLSALGSPERLIPRWAVYLGKISFGLYIFHETAFLLVDEAQKHAARSMSWFTTWPPQHVVTILIFNKVTALGITIVLAMLSYRFFESPFLQLKRHVTWIPSRSV